MEARTSYVNGALLMSQTVRLFPPSFRLGLGNGVLQMEQTVTTDHRVELFQQ